MGTVGGFGGILCVCVVLFVYLFIYMKNDLSQDFYPLVLREDLVLKEVWENIVIRRSEVPELKGGLGTPC